jgi:multidrug efflux pump subunit AcrB
MQQICYSYFLTKPNRTRREGTDAHDAVIKAGVLRFRAIILTSLTTFASLIPMILERSLQAHFLIPMAVSLGFGVLFATVITLLLIPCIYIVFEDVHNLIKKLKTKFAFHLRD